MAMGIYVREVRTPSGVYFWLVESHREGKKVVQKRLKYLGTIPPLPEEFGRLKEEFKDRLLPPKRRGRKPRAKEGK